jgi:hypothetical protein
MNRVRKKFGFQPKAKKTETASARQKKVAISGGGTKAPISGGSTAPPPETPEVSSSEIAVEPSTSNNSQTVPDVLPPPAVPGEQLPISPTPHLSEPDFTPVPPARRDTMERGTQTSLTDDEPDDSPSHRIEEGEEIVKARSELQTAVEKFQKHYERFTKENQQFVRIDETVHAAIKEVETDENVHDSAILFGKQILTAILIRDKSANRPSGKWSSKLSKFLTKFYPIARFSLTLTSAISNVVSVSSFN